MLCSLDEVQDLLLWKVGERKNLPKPTSLMTTTLERMQINGTMFREMTNSVFNQNNTLSFISVVYILMLHLMPESVFIRYFFKVEDVS